ncbi:MAG: c-type cytochrome [Chloroflexota bacterium]
MKHGLPFWAIMLARVFPALALALIGAAIPALAQEGGDQAARYGAAIYAEFCQACHGPRGEAIAGGPAFQAIEFDAATARDVIAQGRDSDPDDGAAMPGYAQTAGGPLSEARLDQVIAYMATWATGDVPPLPAPNLHPTIEQVPDYFGDVQHGAELYATSCYGCHGAEGRGRVPPSFPGFVYNRETFRQVVSAGAGGPAMPGFGVESGGPLSERDLEDLETYVASWGVEPPEAAPSPEGWSTFLVILGVLAVLAVGGYYGGGFSLVGAPDGDGDNAADDAGEQP